MKEPAEGELRRLIPSVDSALQDEELRFLIQAHGRAVVRAELRTVLDEARGKGAAGNLDGMRDLLRDLGAEIAMRLTRRLSSSLVPVINATGVVVHTNLGRAPLSREAAARVAEIASSYSNLELDLATGDRGDREAHAESRLRDLLGAEASVVVNNCAATVLLLVNTLADGREVLVSRGELVEIGGSFRLPDVLRKGGARLREVGTTNRTRLSDYRAALGAETGMILKVLPSNFRIVGFTETPTLEELAGLAGDAGVPLAVDQGSGLLRPPTEALAGEATAGDVLRGGADLVAMSGDKLLGGPQAGLVAGRRVLVEAMRRNPLYRALRVDKMTLAALDAVLAEHEAERSFGSVPVLRMLALTRGEIEARATSLARSLVAAGVGLAAEVVAGNSAVGGGAAPTVDFPTALVALTHRSLSAERLAERLRTGQPPVVARVAEDQVLLDLRTVPPESEDRLRRALETAARETEGGAGPRP
jgi:L-seryl-tRNA(Ser) seleniumtransferase